MKFPILLRLRPLTYGVLFAALFSTQMLKAQTAPPPEATLIKINLPATRLDFYVGGKLQKSYPIAIGMPKYPTPVREFTITQIVWNPWWIPPDSEWAEDAEKTPPGPQNPLGPVKMIMEEGVRIHGTNAPRSIGRAASHACIRMKSPDAVELAWEIQKLHSAKTDSKLLEIYKAKRGTSFYVNLDQQVPVTVHYQQVELNDNQLKIYPDRYGRGGLFQELEQALKAHPEIKVDRALVKKLTQMRRKGVVEISLTELSNLQTTPPTVVKAEGQ